MSFKFSAQFPTQTLNPQIHVKKDYITIDYNKSALQKALNSKGLNQDSVNRYVKIALGFTQFKYMNMSLLAECFSLYQQYENISDCLKTIDKNKEQYFNYLYLIHETLR